MPPAGAKDEYRYRDALAPSSGTIDHCHQGRILASFDWIDLGASAAADPHPGEAVMRIAELEVAPDGVEAVLDLAFQHLHLRGGLVAQDRLARFALTTVEQGEVARTATAIDPRSGTMRVEITLPNPGARIPAGMAGQVILSAPASTGRYLLPVNALLTGQEGTRVALVQDGAVRFVPVRAGRNLGQNVEILSGVDEGARVILSPNALLRDGDRVTIAEAQKAAPK